MLHMLFKSATVYQYIIEKDNHKVAEPWSQGGIHGTLKCAWSTGQAKRHHPELILTQMGLEGSLVLFTGFEQDLMKPSTEVQISKPIGLGELVHKLTEDWNKEFGLGCKSIKMVEIDAKPVGSIFFLDEEHW